MKIFYCLLVLILLLYSCKDEEDCTFRLADQEYNNIPYKYGDGLLVCFFDTIGNTGDTILFEEMKDEYSIWPNVDPLGISACNGTFDSYEVYFEDINTKVSLRITKENNTLSIIFEIVFDSLYLSPFIEPYENYGNFSYDNTAEIDGKPYYSVYTVNSYYGTIYYSTVTGLIKLETDSGIYRFETIRS
jgi:hypothetical protein